MSGSQIYRSGVRVNIIYLMISRQDEESEIPYYVMSLFY